MSRFLSREDRPLVAGGILAGLLTSVLVLYLFVTGIGGDGGGTEIVTDTMRVLEREDLVRGEVRDEKPARAPLIGARERDIRSRLARFPVQVRRIRGAIAVTARNVAWNEAGGARFARAERVRASLDLAAAERGNIVLEDVVLESPDVTIREQAGGWNFEQVFAELLDDDGDVNGDPRAGPQRIFRLEDVRIEDGTVDVIRPDQRFGFRAVSGTLPAAVFSEPGLAAPYVRAAELAAEFVQAEPEARLAMAVTNGLFIFPSGTVRFAIEGALLDRTRLADLDGVWDPGDPGYGVTATGLALEVNFEDLAFALPESFPDTGLASFAFDVQPAPPELTRVALTDLDAASGDSRLLGAVTMVLGGDAFELVSADLRADPIALELIEAFTGPIPYGGELLGTITGAGRDISFDLTARLTAPSLEAPFDAGLIGTVSFGVDGVDLRRLVIDLDAVPLAAVRVVAPTLPLTGTVTGSVTLTGPPGRTPLDLDVRLELGAGIAIVEGVLDLTGAVPSYDLSGRLLGLDLQSVLEPSVPPVALTASFSVAGSGFDPAAMNTDLRLAGRFTGWESTPRDTITLVATIRGGTLGIEMLRGSLATADVEASGSWRFTAPQSGAITYAFDVASLRPFGPYIPVVGDSIAAGAIRSAGTLSGTLERLQVAGDADGTGLRVGAWEAATFAGVYDLTFGGDRLPVAIVDAEVANVTTPTAGNYTTGTLALRLTPPGLDLRVDATRTDGGLVEIAATGVLPEFGQREVRLERARFDLADDRWMLAQPATFRWVADGPVFVDAFEIRSERSSGRVAIEGRVLPLATLDVQVGVAALPVGDIQRLLGRPVRLDGLLWVDGTVRGDQRDALVDLEFRVDAGAFDGVTLDEFAGTLEYAGGETRIEAQVVVDTAGRMDVVARLPSVLRLGGDPWFELVDGVPLSGSVTADRFAIAPLLAPVRDVRDVSGYADARVTLAGTVEAPEVEGTFTLLGGAFHVPALNQRFTETSGDITLEGRRLIVNDLRVRSEGWLTVGGEIVLERLTEPVLDLTIALDAFEPMGVDDHPDAGFWGDVELTGPPNALVLTGAIEVADGYIVVPELGGPSFRPELVDMTRPAALDTLAFRPDGETGIIENLEIRDLRVDVSTDTWFDAYQAQVQLAGELVVDKTGSDLPIVGTLSGNRGQYTLIAGPVIRRFEIVSAEVRFRGEPSPNPAIDITARRIVLDESGRQLDVDVRITGTADAPTLQLAGGGAGQIAESELLSFLLFGMPSSTLGEQLPGDQLLGQTYVGAFWEVFALELERSLGGLGLDIFQIRLGQGSFGFESPTIVAGAQVAPDVFLTIETALNGLFGDGTADLTTWTIRLDWSFDRRTRLRLALEPIYRGRGLRSSTFALPLADPRQQLLIELRRRWTY